jgi:hypothetical protein
MVKTHLTKHKIPWLLVVLLAAIAFSAQAQANLPPLAAVTSGQLTLYGFGAGPQPVTRGLDRFTTLEWSPDGQHLAFVMADPGSARSLMFTDRGGSPPSLLAQNVTYLPVTFTPDSRAVIYTEEGAYDAPTGSPPGTPAIPLRVLARELAPGSEPQVLGQITFGVGCGGGSPYPMDGVYNAEAGFGGNSLAFTRTDHGILYSTSCTGHGLALFDPGSGESLSLGDNLSSAVLSPDGSRFAAVRDRGIALVSLAERTQTNFQPQFVPDQLAWGDGQTLYYSARALLPDPLPLSQEEAQVFTGLFGAAADTMPQYSVSIHRLDVNSGAEAQVYSGPGWAVGRMFFSQGALYFSLVPNGETWIEALTTGQIDYGTYEGILREWQTVAATLYRLQADGQAVEAGHDIGQAQPHPSALGG